MVRKRRLQGILTCKWVFFLNLNRWWRRGEALDRKEVNNQDGAFDMNGIDARSKLHLAY